MTTTTTRHAKRSLADRPAPPGRLKTTTSFASQLQQLAPWNDPPRPADELEAFIDDLSMDEYSKLEYFLQRAGPGASEQGDAQTPACVIDLISHPEWSTQARALAHVLLPESQCFAAWLQFAGRCVTDDDISRRVKLCWHQIAGVPTGEMNSRWGKIGWQLVDGVTPAVWFETANGKQNLIGSPLIAMIRELFQIGTEGHGAKSRKAEAARDKKTGKRKPPADAGGSPDHSHRSRNGGEGQGEGDGSTSPPTVAGQLKVHVSQIDVVHNARTDFDRNELDRLTQSIRRFGILQPLLVKRVGDRYQLVAGERRLRAAHHACLDVVPVSIASADQQSTALMALDENLKRVDLNPIDRARELQRLRDEHGMTQAQIAEFVGCTQGQVSNELRLLQLPDKWQGKVAAGELAPTLVRSLLPYSDLPQVFEQLEKELQGTDVVNEITIGYALKDAIAKVSRPMKYDAGWCDYGKPDAKKRHFQKLSADDEKELAPRKIDGFSEWEGKERTFNVAKFNELNKEPLAKRMEKFKKRNAKRRAAGTAEKKPQASPFKEYAEYRIESEIESTLSAVFVAALRQCNDHAAVDRVMTTLAIAGRLTACGGCTWTDGYVRRVLQFVDKDNRTTWARAMLVFKELDRLNAGDVVTLAGVIGCDVLAQWVPSKKLLADLSPHGLKLCAELLELPPVKGDQATAIRKAWPPGLIPDFLRPLFKIPKLQGKKPRKSAAKKK